jgi:hypothetical protein
VLLPSLLRLGESRDAITVSSAAADTDLETSPLLEAPASGV